MSDVQYAIVEIGSLQYRVSPGARISVGMHLGTVGETITLGRTLAVHEAGELQIGKPTTVLAEVMEQGRDRKILVFKKKRRKGYERKKGHRQAITWLKVTEIRPAATAEGR